jgi:hypothetical protein
MPDRRRAASWLLLPMLLAAGCASGPGASRPIPEVAPPTGSPGARATVVGTLIDTHCYSLDRAYAADDHRTPNGTIEACAQACARLGIPVGLLTSSGSVVVLLAPSPDLADHMGDEARAVGTRTLNGSLRPDSVFVHDDGDAWTPVPLHQMM